MSLRIHNTLTRSKEIFEPVTPGKVGIYVCGPTVYKSPHVGHLVGPLIFDAIKRYLVYKGFEVRWVVNITDVDDKLIAAAQKRGKSVQEVAEQHTAEYQAVLRDLGIDTIDHFPKVSDHMPEIIAIIQKLVDGGHAYAVEGNVWFDVSKDKDYGKLSGRSVEEQAAGSRELEGSGKRNPADFALWKAAKPGEPSWPSPWGAGRPGWHIECSAMSIKYLGETFDIHGGGDDLRFPHHENELAQSESATGKTFARYWMHNGLTKFNTKKISGSDFENDSSAEMQKIKQSVDAANLVRRLGPQLLRYLILSTHYRSPIDFSDEVIEANRKGLRAFSRLVERVGRVGVNVGVTAAEIEPASRELMGSSVDGFIKEILSLKMKWLEMMDDDFNTAGAIAVMHEIVGASNQFITSSKLESQKSDQALQALSAAVATLGRLASILGLELRVEPETGDDLSGKLMDLIIQVRNDARASKNFAVADLIRNRLAEIGVTLEDRPGETGWRRI
jgi:cysteinyl-tRNA synthetase